MLFSLLGLSAIEVKPGSPNSYDQSLKLVSFESVDLARLTSELKTRQDSLSESELDGLVQRNLHYIYYNRINRNHFLVAPKPEHVIDQIDLILQLNRRLRAALSQGRSLMGKDCPRDDLRALLDEVRFLVQELKSEFFEFFVEGHVSKYSLMFSDSRDSAVLFALFLVQSDRISAELNREFEQYFFDASPGAISLDEYRESSIGTLMESLEMLANGFAERIADSGVTR